MKRVARIVASALACLMVTAPLAAQDRTLVLSLYGGGADHLADLQSNPQVWFMPGYNLGVSLGVQLNQYFAVHGDFTYTRNPSRGATLFAGSDVNRFFYGAHVEGRYPFSNGFAPFAFAGLGAVTVDQLGVDRFEPFTRPAVMYGGGMFYAIPRSRVEVFGEIKGLTYRWNTAGFHRTMFDVTYSAGVSYRLPYSF
ncbi:MAG TPA: outer membrane beta-barrel protein [Gemmatimonadales bacterium]|jgi:opacity protein-like surface antigen